MLWRGPVLLLALAAALLALPTAGAQEGGGLGGLVPIFPREPGTAPEQPPPQEEPPPEETQPPPAEEAPAPEPVAPDPVPEQPAPEPAPEPLPSEPAQPPPADAPAPDDGQQNPLLDALQGRDEPKKEDEAKRDEAKPEKADDEPARVPLHPDARPARALARVPQIIGLSLLAFPALALLALALVAATRAGRPRQRRPARKTAEAARAAALARRPVSEEEALALLGRAPVGRLVAARPLADGFQVEMARGRGQRCEAASGYLAGLFLSAWARDVEVEHPECAGKRGTCVYVVRPRRVSASAPPTGGASTPGSGGARRRWPRARAGGG